MDKGKNKQELLEGVDLSVIPEGVRVHKIWWENYPKYQGWWVDLRHGDWSSLGHDPNSKQAAIEKALPLIKKYLGMKGVLNG